MYMPTLIFITRSSQWRELMTVKVIMNEEASSVGDALRDLDEKHMISTDFVLVQGDLVANLDLKTCMQQHKYVLYPLGLICN